LDVIVIVVNGRHSVVATVATIRPFGTGVANLHGKIDPILEQLEGCGDVPNGPFQQVLRDDTSGYFGAILIIGRV